MFFPNYTDINSKSDKIAYKSIDDGLAYLSDLLSITEESFDDFLKKDSEERHKQALKDKRLMDRCPILYNACKFPNLENITLLQKESIDELDNDLAASAYFLFYKLLTDDPNKIDYIKKAYELTDSKRYLYYYSLERFREGKHDEAFNGFVESMPYSFLSLSECYEKGLGVKKSLKTSYKILEDEAINNNKVAIKALKKLIDKYSIQWPEAIKWKSITSTCLSKEQKALLLEAAEDGYVTTSDIYSILDHDRYYLYKNGIKFLHKNNVKVVEAIDAGYDDNLGIAEMLYKMVDKYSKRLGYDVLEAYPNKCDKEILELFELTSESVSFYRSFYDSFVDEDFEMELKPSDVARGLDISKDEATIKLYKLAIFRNSYYYGSLLKDLIYKLKVYLNDTI